MLRRLQWRIAGGYLALLSIVLVALGAYVLQTLRGGGTPEATIRDVATAIASTLIAAAILTTLLGYLIARSIARPIEALSQTAGRLSADDLRPPGPIEAGPEVGELATAFAAMAARWRQRVRTVEQERTWLASVLAHIPDGVMITDATGCVTLHNPAAARLLRFDPATAGGQPLIEATRDYELTELVDRALRGGSPTTTSRLVEIGPPGVRGWVQGIASRLPDHPVSGARVLLVLQDVTELRRTEAIRRDFVANVSHELRTPVTSLKAMVEALEEGALEDMPVARDFLARMDVEVDGLIRLIEELLALSRIESGRLAPPLRPTHPGPVVAAAAERLRPQADRQGLGLVVNTHGATGPVLADPEQLQQIVISLVHNAIKFTPPGGRITIDVVQPESEVQVRVRDTGEGIPADELERLFERFYKADKSRASGGTGLGLAIAKHLVQLHGGRIWAESPGPSLGSTFTVALPAIAVGAPVLVTNS